MASVTTNEPRTKPPDASSRRAGSGVFQRRPLIFPLLSVGALVGLVLAIAAHLTIFIALGLPAALVLVYLAVDDPLIALCLLQVVSWSNISTVVGSHHGLSAYLLALAVGVISIVVAVRRGGRLVFGRTPLYVLLAGVVLAGGVSLLASPYSTMSLATPVERIKDVVFFFVTVALIRLSGRILLVVKVIVITIAVLSALTLIQQYVLHNSTTLHGLANIPTTAGVGGATARHSGTEVDPNFWGRILVLVLPLSVSLCLLRTRRRAVKAMWLLAVVSILGSAYLSQSRGGLLATAAVIFIWALIVGWRRPRRLLAAAMGIVIVILALPGLTSRLSTLGELGRVSPGITDPSLVERVQAQEVGLAMFRANPATGVGLGNFIPVETQFVTRPGITDTGTLYAAHDFYLETAAEQGILGVAAWLLFLGGALIIALRAAISARNQGLQEEWLLALGAAIAVVGWAAASAVLQMADFNDLLAVVALIAVVDMRVTRKGDLLLRRRVRRSTAEEVIRRHRRALVLRRTAAVMAVGAVVAVAGVAFVPAHRPMWEAQATAAVVPEPSPASGYDAYAWATVERQTLLPTLASIAGERMFLRSAAPVDPPIGPVQVTTTYDINAATLHLQVRAASPQTAEKLATATLSNAKAYIRSLITLYQVETVATGAATRIQPSSAPALALGGGLIGLTLIVAVGIGRRTWRGTARVPQVQ